MKTSEALKLAKFNAKEAQRKEAFDLAKIVLTDPLAIGLMAMAGNELAYRSGLYDPAPGEKPESALGGPVWITIGPSLPPAQQKRNLINGMIIGVTTARALAPAMPLVAKGVDNFGALAKGLMLA